MSENEQLLTTSGARISNVGGVVESLQPGAFARMPFACRVFAENVVRKVRGPKRDVYLRQIISQSSNVDFPFYPARVVLQDLLGTPALVDLAGLREAVAEAGGSPEKVNPVVPTQLVVDHSLNVDVSGADPQALAKNMAVEQEKNAERFAFLSWARTAFDNLEIVMPGNGILHQINVERMSPVVHTDQGTAFPDTLVGTDSHTTMINALGVLGWGVGGIEAESVMLGRPIWMRLPQIVGVRLTGRRAPGVQATDIVLALTEFLRNKKVVGCILEFGGPAVDQLTLADRATVANMAPEFGATAAMFPIDDNTIDFLLLTGRGSEQAKLVEEYARAQGLWASDLATAHYVRQLEFDISNVGLAIAGPANPHQRVPLDQLVERGVARAGSDAGAGGLQDGSIVIAAITSCTNTSNPRNMIAAGLVAQRARKLGLETKPWVKTSFAPGSKAVELYMEDAGLMPAFRELGFGIVGFGCTSCNGMSGPLPVEIEKTIVASGLKTVAVLSGNRNFNGRIHPRVTDAFIGSPALVIAYAIAGSIHIDVSKDPIGANLDGNPVMLADLWPTDAEVDAILERHVRAEQFASVYNEVFGDDDPAGSRDAVPLLFDWDEDSTYIRRPPYWERRLRSLPSCREMRPIAILGDNVTTDDLSPSGAILPESAAGRFLQSHGITPPQFNSYGTRRGDHSVAVMATFANNRLRNEMASGEGSLTTLQPDGREMLLFEAAQEYQARGQELIVIAGKNYGCGSSRDWAAKGVRLIGVRAVLCESFERIHRSNLVGMGVLPLEFEAGTTRATLKLDGTEIFALEDFAGAPAPGAWLTMTVKRTDGTQEKIRVKCRIETSEEQQIFESGGLLPRIADECLATVAAN